MFLSMKSASGKASCSSSCETAWPRSLTQISEQGKLNDEVTQLVENALNEFKAQYVSGS